MGLDIVESSSSIRMSFLANKAEQEIGLETSRGPFQLEFSYDPICIF